MVVMVVVMIVVIGVAVNRCEVVGSAGEVSGSAAAVFTINFQCEGITVCRHGDTVKLTRNILTVVVGDTGEGYGIAVELRGRQIKIEIIVVIIAGCVVVGFDFHSAVVNVEFVLHLIAGSASEIVIGL